MRRCEFLWMALAVSASALSFRGSICAQAPPDFSAVEPIFARHCLDCHSLPEPEGELVLEDQAAALKGGESGAVVIPGKSAESLLIRLVEGRLEKDGKKWIMPPGKRDKLTAQEIATIRDWIDGGARPASGKLAKALEVPKIEPKVPPARGVTALAYAKAAKLLAIGRYQEVELMAATGRVVTRTLRGHSGNVNALVFSPDGKRLYAAGGEPGRGGEIRRWDVVGGLLERVIEGHNDAIYGLALSRDGKVLATGSYDQKIKLWNAETGEEIRTLSGHNGAVFSVAFRGDGKVLASASADRTVKLWEVETGERRDTLSQSLKELHAVAFSPNGKHLAAGGVDNRIRVWAVSETASETTNPLLVSTFAHDGAILGLSYSADGKSLVSVANDRTVKLWEAEQVRERQSLDAQPDWPGAVAWMMEDRWVAVGRMDGTLGFYDAESGRALPPPKPALARSEPRGIERGRVQKFKLVGTNLLGVFEITAADARLQVSLDTEKEATESELWAGIAAPADLPRGSYELSVKNPHGESNRLKIHVDDLPQIYPEAKQAGNLPEKTASLPASFWGCHEKSGQTGEFRFEGRAGETLVFDLAARRLGSKADSLLMLYDAGGRLLASGRGYAGSPDPFLAHTFEADGTYVVRVVETLLAASPDHFFRLSIGRFPFVTGYHPLGIRAGEESQVELIGYNLPPGNKVRVKADKPGELDLPIDGETYRTRQPLKIWAGDLPEQVESEPNDAPEHAFELAVPGAVNGRLWAGGGAGDSDWYRFGARAGETWVIETAAAQRGSPADTRIEVLRADGQPIERLVLQAVRDSAVTFRGIDSNTADCRVENWEEMELNEYLYLQGEIVRLFRAPQGPDSGFLFYSRNGKRRAYFDSSPTAHALDEPCYIVRPHPPGAKLVATGLPAFTIYYANDDDGERKLGTDSRVHFTAPADGTYLVRVTDTRGYAGERFVYRLAVRPARPSFKVTLNGAHPTVPAGSGQSFSVTAERLDGFEGEIRVEILDVPAGFLVSSPLVIQSEHVEAKGTLFATRHAQAPPTNAPPPRLRATAQIDGREVVQEAGDFGVIQLGPPPKLYVRFEPYHGESAGPAETDDGDKLAEITLAPGAAVPAWLRIRRHGHDELVTFTVDNLPHGVIVDNIGLNGVLIPKGEQERQIFLTAAKWVPQTERICFAVENQAGRQTSRPVLLRIRPAPEHRAAAP